MSSDLGVSEGFGQLLSNHFSLTGIWEDFSWPEHSNWLCEPLCQSQMPEPAPLDPTKEDLLF